AIIAEGRVKVNGATVDSPALNVTPADLVELDGAPLAAPERTRMWRYHKPAGLVTSEADEKGRATVFDNLPADLPRVVSVGRLDLNSEGLLLLTNDGDLKRRLELPSTGWLRKYRVRVFGAPDDKALEPLRKGMVVEGERFQPMTATVDRLQGRNAWLTVSLREGRNREVRRALGALGFEVSRLIRVSYGPFLLGELAPGEAEEIRPKVLRDQLGLGPAPKETRAPGAGLAAGRTDPAEEDDDAPRRRGNGGGGAGGRPARSGPRLGPGRPGLPKPEEPRPARGGPGRAGQAKAGQGKAGLGKAGLGAAKPSGARAGTGWSGGGPRREEATEADRGPRRFGGRVASGEGAGAPRGA
ncbi:MAG: pseudouridine synthase, partial [Pseudomonadota bacterium]|nr:pseudouridine synthase [Pseudomonadota bacterium]